MTLSSMENSKRQFVCAIQTCVIAILVLPHAVNGQLRHSSRFVIDSSINARLEIQKFRERFKQDLNASTIARVFEARALYGNEIAPVAPHHWQRVGYSLDVLLGELKPQDLNTYRKTIEPIAASRLIQATKSLATPKLRDVVENTYHSQSAEKAIHQLAEDAWHTGNFDLARHYWTQLVPLPTSNETTFPIRRLAQSRTSTVKILRRLVFCSLARGDDRQAEKQWGVLCRLYPQEFDRDQFRKMKASFSNVSDDVVEANELRFGWSHRLDSRQPLSPSQVTFSSISVHEKRIPRLFAITGDSVWGFKARDGTPLWPVIGDDMGHRVFQRISDSSSNTQSPAVSVLAVNEQRLLATYEDAIFCLDVAEGEGKLHWRYPMICADCDSNDFQISSQPFHHNGNLYFAIRNGKQSLQSALVCLDIDSGELEFKKVIGTRLAASKNAPDARDVLTAGIGHLFMLTNDGLLAACQANSGQIEWVVDFSSVASRNEDTTNQWNMSYHAGKIFALAPNRSDVYALDASSGLMLWKSNTPMQMSSIVGVVDGILVLRGARLVGIDVESGSIAWKSAMLPTVLHAKLSGAMIHVVTNSERIFISSIDGTVMDSASTGAVFPQHPLIISNSSKNAVTVGDSTIQLYSIPRTEKAPTKRLRHAY